MEKGKNLKLSAICQQVRGDILRMVTEVGKCHLAGPLSSVELLVALYSGQILKYDSQKPLAKDQDRFILSCGHYAPAWYSVLARNGFFNPSKLTDLRKIDSFLQGHPSRLHANFVQTSTGSLGQGLSVGLGMALGLRLRKQANNVWALTSDA